MHTGLLFRLVDRYTLQMLKTYNLLNESQWLPYDGLRDLQLAKLRELGKHFELEIVSWDDFHRLPLTSKEQLRSYLPKVKRYAMSETSGSTGNPFKFARPLERGAINKATELRNWEWLGWNGQFSFRLTRGEPNRKMRLYNLLLNIACKNYRTIDNSYVELLRKHPQILHGGTSSIRELTWLANMKCDTNCILIGEDPSDHISKLADHYDGIYQSYGLSECVNIAFECSHHSLHVNMENCIVEEKDNELIITNLNNYVTPFIRYKTGDKGRVEGSKCKCGRKLDVIVGLEGKSVDFYAGPEVAKPLGWWLVSPLGHQFHHYFRQYKVQALPKEGLIKVYVIPKTGIQEVTALTNGKPGYSPRGLHPYLVWLKNQTGLRATLDFVDEIPESRKLFEVIK